MSLESGDNPIQMFFGCFVRAAVLILIFITVIAVAVGCFWGLFTLFFS